MKRFVLLLPLALVFFVSGCRTAEVSSPDATARLSRDTEEPIYPAFESPVYDLVTTEAPPAWFDSTAAVAMVQEAQLLRSSVLSVSSLETAVVDDRSEHIANACQGEKAGYVTSVASFAGSAIFTVGSAALGNVGFTWNGLRTSFAALAAVNVSRAAWKSCQYREGLAYDQSHPHD